MASKYDSHLGERDGTTDWAISSEGKLEGERAVDPEIIVKAEDRGGGGGRRPMNAFLIFCKRQRSEVRRRYPNLENRAVTRVLGEWWASLSTSEKESYVRLASQYKEAYMKAHPEFRWNRMPAVTSSPTRLMATRPKPRLANPQFNQGQIVPGKLADESQLGGLSSLLAKSAQPVAVISQVPKPPKKRYLEENYTEQEQNGISNNDTPNGLTQGDEKILANQESVPVINGEKENTDAVAQRMRIWRNTLLYNKSDEHVQGEEEEEEEEEEDETEVNNNKETNEEEDGGRGRARACKGRRYKEFMWRNLVTRRRRWDPQDLIDPPVSKRKLREKREDLKEAKDERDRRKHYGREDIETKRGSIKTNKLKEGELHLIVNHNEEINSKIMKEELGMRRYKQNDGTGHMLYTNQFPGENVPHENGKIENNNFNLEERIDALPPLSIEEFHNRKRSRKTTKTTSPILTATTGPRTKGRKDNNNDFDRGIGNLHNRNVEECLNNNVTSVVNNNNMVLCGPQCVTGRIGCREEEKEAVIGSRKRKLRRQGIRRLQPGSTFKDTSVVEVASPDIIGLTTLADVAANKPRLISK